MIKQDEVITYAQNREDLIIEALLYDVKQGFYVDIGANDPTIDSVTKRFYDKGWTGINVEPNPSQYQKLLKKRKKDINLQIAISNKKGKIQFREYTNGYNGWSTGSSKMKAEHKHQNIPYKEYPVYTETLRSILGKYAKGVDIDFIKIDVEGMEFNVLSGNDWSTYRPTLIIIEANHIEKDWQYLLQSVKYIEVFFDGLNKYFVSEENKSKIDFENFIKVMTEGKPIISLRELQQRSLIKNDFKSKLTQLEKAIITKEKAIITKDRMIQEERQKVNELQDVYNWAITHPLRFAGAKIYRKLMPKDRDEKTPH